MERGSTIATYNKIDVESNGPIVVRATLDTKKRGSEEDLEKPAKQVRMDGAVDSVSITGASSTPAVPYVAPSAAQPPYYPQGQWGTPGYTGYPPNAAQQVNMLFLILVI